MPGRYVRVRLGDVRRIAIPDESRKWWTLGAVSFGLFMVMLDNTVVNVALPTIGRKLEVGISELEWVVNAYTLTFAVLMLVGGKLADLFGRRRFYIAGLSLFTLSSLACGLAPSASFLIGARAVQGIGAALLSPATLSIITATFPREERGTAIGIWAGVASVGVAIGPLAGGLLTEHASWSWVFFVNVPIGVLAVAVAPFLVRESLDDSLERRLDLPAVAVSGAALFALTYALIEANSRGWGSPLIVGLLCASAAGIAGFVALERRTRVPMLDLSLFRSAVFSGGNLVVLLIGFALFGIVVYLSLYMQTILGYSPVRTGTIQLPYTGLIVVVAPLAGKLTDRLGPRLPVSVGALLMSVSLYLFSRLGVDSGFLDILPGLLVGGIGVGLAMGPSSTAVLSAVPVRQAGIGSGVLQTFRQTGGVLGVAVLGAILTASIATLPFDPRYPEQFVGGLHDALLAAAAFALAGALVGALTIDGKAPVRQRTVPAGGPATAAAQRTTRTRSA
jgi:EmrB/QacA subfamily drug resistance transporter